MENQKKIIFLLFILCCFGCKNNKCNCTTETFSLYVDSLGQQVLKIKEHRYDSGSYVGFVKTGNKLEKIEDFIDCESFQNIFDGIDSIMLGNFYYKYNHITTYFKDKNYIYFYLKDYARIPTFPYRPNYLVNMGKSNEYEVISGPYLRIGNQIFYEGNKVKKSIGNDVYSMEIETFCLNDTLASDESEYTDGVFSLVTRPIIVKQKLLFKKSGKIQRQFDIPIKNIYRTNYKGEKIKCLEQNIWQMFFIHGIKGGIFGISGTGLCRVSECPEFSGFYTENGDVLWQGDNRDNGFDLNSLYHIYGITDSLVHGEMNDGIRIDIFWNNNER